MLNPDENKLLMYIKYNLINFLLTPIAWFVFIMITLYNDHMD